MRAIFPAHICKIQTTLIYETYSHGYEVKVIIPQPDGTQQEVSNVLYGDPLIPYTDSEGNLMDTDEDGIPDVVEAWFAQTNWSWTRSALHTSLYENVSAASAIALYTDYAWYVNYGVDLAEEGENATKWAQTTFNPFVRDTGPPILAYFEVRNVVEYDWWGVKDCYAEITYEFRDPSGIDMVRLIKLGAGANYDLKFFNGAKIASETVTLSIDYWLDYLADYEVNITAKDSHANTLYGVKRIKGVFGGIIDVIRKLWEAFVSALEAAWKTLTEAVNFILSWLKDTIMGIINATMEEIKKTMGDFYAALLSHVWNLYNSTAQGVDNKEALDKLGSFLGQFNWIYGAFLAMVVALDLLTYIMEGLTFGIGTLVTTIIIPIVMITVVELFLKDGTYNELKPEGYSITLDIQYIINFVRNWLSSGAPGAQKDSFGISEDSTASDILYGVVSMIMGFWSWVFGLVVKVNLPQNWCSLSALLGALSWWVFGLGAVFATPFFAPVADILGILAITTGVASLIITGYGLSRAIKPGIGSYIAFGISVIFGIIGVGTGIESLSFV